VVTKDYFRMSLVSADVFLGLVRLYRLLWISGRYGGGKTALAYRIAYDLLQSGFVRYVVSNTDSVWSSKFEDVVPRYDERGMPILDTCVILDEGGLFLKTTKDADEYMSFLRKLNVILLMPSVTPVSSRLRSLNVMREFNARRIGLPIWMYKYTLSQGVIRESERFYWFNPQEIYGIYDTFATPVDDTGISDWLAGYVEVAVKAYYARTGRQRVERKLNPIYGVEGAGGNFGDFLEASENIASASDVISASLAKRQSGRR